MPVIVPIAVTAGGVLVIVALFFAFLRGTRFGLRRRMHRQVQAHHHRKAED